MKSSGERIAFSTNGDSTTGLSNAKKKIDIDLNLSQKLTQNGS